MDDVAQYRRMRGRLVVVHVLTTGGVEAVRGTLTSWTKQSLAIFSNTETRFLPRERVLEVMPTETP